MRHLAACLLLAISSVACAEGAAPIAPDPTGAGGGDGATGSGGGAGGDDGAGGGSVDTPAGYEPGDRLRAVTVNGADGSAQQVGWFDAERGEPCSYRVAADGQLRCLPAATAFLGYYSDNTCSRRLATVNGACSPPRYLAAPVGVAGCYSPEPFAIDPASGVSIRPVGQAYSGPTYTLVDAQCTPATAVGAHFTTGDAVDPSAFVAGSYEGL